MEISDCNWFRANYDKMSFCDLQDFYNRMAREHPDQSHYEWPAVVKFFFKIRRQQHRVAELGGWDGELAFRVLERFSNVKRWTNYEIARVKHRKRRGYRHPRLSRPAWELRCKFSVLVASHVLEHIKPDEVGSVVDWANRSGCQYIYVDTPQIQDHTNALDTHVLVYPEDEFVKIFTSRGWELEQTTEGKFGHSTVRYFKR